MRPGSVLIPPSLNGRIFCQLDGELIHRLTARVCKARRRRSTTTRRQFSLAAPEGGPFASTTGPAATDGWCRTHQQGRSNHRPRRTNRALVEKRISLKNRKVQS